MAEDSMALIELMQKADGGDFLRSLAEAVCSFSWKPMWMD